MDQDWRAADERRQRFYQKLRKAAPRLWREPDGDGPKWHATPSTPESWNDLILQLSVDIEKVFTAVEEVIAPHEFPFVQQCKEKFGELRFYYSACPEIIAPAVDKLVSQAEHESASICCVCGTTDTTVIRSRYPEPFENHFFGWICPYCDDCHFEEALSRAKRSERKELRRWYHETMKKKKK